MGTPSVPLGTHLAHREYSLSTPRVPRASPVRTSVGALPHVAEDFAVLVVAADDVDGAGGVDHGTDILSYFPRRAVDHGGPGDACGHTGDRLIDKTDDNRKQRTRGRPPVAAEL